MNKTQNRKLAIIVTVVLALALVGLFVIDINSVVAERASGDTNAAVSSSGVAADRATPFSVTTPIGSIVKMVSALIVVIFSVYVGLYLLKRLMAARGRRDGRDNLLEVIQSTYVGPKKSVSLLRVADRSVLIGVTDNSISVLTELDPEETAAILATETKVERKDGFRSLLGTAASKVRKLNLKRNPAIQEG